MSTIPRLVISAPSSGHGKTAVSVGLLAALSARGYRAAGFKIGPDHVDAAYLGLAAGRPGRNLDPRLVGAKRMGPLFAHGATSLDIAVVEGTMGLFDGLAGRTDSESTAQISGLLRAPVILVVDVGAMGQSVAALVHGFRAYDELLWLGGVILNRVASSRHEQLLREALDDIGVPVLGALRRHALSDAGDAGAPLPSRHHGVAPVVHHNIDAVRAVRRLGEVIASAVDIDRTMALARSAPRLISDAWNAEAEVAAAGASDAAASSLAATRIGRRPVVGVAFAYPETAELLTAAGAEVVPFDPLRDEALPANVDGLVIGAALPESYAEELTFNGRLRSAVAAHAAAGKPIAAEGAGLVWLCRDYNGRPMCGVVDASARDTDLVVLGYREATARSSSVLLPVGAQVIGHKMHRTTITPRAGQQAAWTWAGGPAEGFVQRGVHASYLGLHWAGAPSIASRFVAAASATAAPAPGQWSTPSTSPYGRPSVPQLTFPTALVTGVPAAAGAPSYTADYTAPEPAAPPRLPGSAIPGSILSSPGGPGSIAALAADPLAADPPAFDPAAVAPAVPSPPLTAAGSSAVSVSSPAASSPPVSVSSPAAGWSPGPVLSAGPVSSPVSATSAVPGSTFGAVAASGVPANAPTSPGASSPFGPGLGPAMPLSWTSPSLSEPVALASSSASALPASSTPVSSAPSSAAAPSAPPASASVSPVSVSPASAAADSASPVVLASEGPLSAAPTSALSAPAGQSSATAVAGAPLLAGPGFVGPGSVDRDSAGPGSAGPGFAGPGFAGSASGGAGSEGSGSAGSAAKRVSSGIADMSDISVVSDEADWFRDGDLGEPGVARSGPGLPAVGLVTSGPWSAGPADGADEDAAAALPGDTLPTAMDEASVGVPSGSNGPVTAAGLPSSGVVPTTVAISPPTVPSRPSTAQPLSAAEPASAARPVSPAPGGSAAHPVSTPPAVGVRPAGMISPATSAAMPVSSAPMPRAPAPVSAAPVGVTAMPAAESELVPSPGDGPGTYPSPSLPGAGLPEQAPVSAPPVSAPPSSGSSVEIASIPAAPVSVPVSGPPGSVVSGSVPSSPVSGSPSGPVPVSAPPGSAPAGPASGSRSVDAAPGSLGAGDLSDSRSAEGGLGVEGAEGLVGFRPGEGVAGSGGSDGDAGGAGSGGGKPPAGGSSEAA
ncbi:cobyrinate a,c-diamide synthase [Dactylosporangium sp. NPDC051484]|uniref:cobyrinate a,c-diamide synthase n=1 Tax=Dactylosporangium sp. NPDC051484 TaxID=3154942 RepID=UPI00344DD78A